MKPSVDSLKLERDGHFYYTRNGIIRPEDRPLPEWLIERDETGMPIRMRWTGVRATHTEGDEPDVAP